MCGVCACEAKARLCNVPLVRSDQHSHTLSLRRRRSVQRITYYILIALLLIMMMDVD